MPAHQFLHVCRRPEAQLFQGAETPTKASANALQRAERPKDSSRSPSPPMKVASEDALNVSCGAPAPPTLFKLAAETTAAMDAASGAGYLWRGGDAPAATMLPLFDQCHHASVIAGAVPCDAHASLVSGALEV